MGSHVVFRSKHCYPAEQIRPSRIPFMRETLWIGPGTWDRKR